MRGFFMCFSQLVDTGSGQVEKCRSALASGAAAAVRPQSTGVCRLRGEPRQCGDRAHRLIPPSMAPTGERRPSMACLRPIPARPRLSPPECPWLRRFRLRHAPPKRRSPRREGRRCKGFAFEWYMDVPRPRVGAGRATTRRTRTPCSGGPRPKRSGCPCRGAPPEARRSTGHRLDAGQAQDTMAKDRHAVHCNRPRTITTAIVSVTSAISASGHRLATRSAAGVARRTTPCTISR